VRSVTASFPAGYCTLKPLARGEHEGRQVLIKSDCKGMTPEEASRILVAGAMHRVRQIDAEVPTWLTRWTTYLLIGGGRQIMVEEVRLPAELPLGLVVPDHSDVPTIALPDDLFVRVAAEMRAPGLAGAASPDV